MASRGFKRLVRFIPRSDSRKILIGQPHDDKIDVGLALYQGREVIVNTFTGSSVLNPGVDSGKKESIDRVLSPLSAQEVGTIRCIGLNYKNHAEELGMDLPKVPTIFMKPNTSLASPWPQPVVIPRISQEDNSGDYEAELAVVIGKTGKNIAEKDALDHVLGYTACNDVSSRVSQMAQSQWCFSKSFDTSCPMGPTLVSPDLISDVKRLKMRGLMNDKVLQESGIDDLIFGIPKLISFLSQGTTLPAGTVIVTGTPAGVGMMRKPKVSIKSGDVFAVEILPHIGTLINKFENEDATKSKL